MTDRCRHDVSEDCPDCMQETIDKLVKALEFIRDGYDNQDVNHVDFRVKAYQVACDALTDLIAPRHT